MQELILSKDPRIQVGSDRMIWDVFTEFILQDNGQAREDLDLKCLIDMQELQDQFLVNKVQTKKAIKSDIVSSACDYSLQILQSRRGHRVSDPRYIIYAHLGMLKHSKNDEGIDFRSNSCRL